jgi:hypothetical protein
MSAEKSQIFRQMSCDNGQAANLQIPCTRAVYLHSIEVANAFCAENFA